VGLGQRCSCGEVGAEPGFGGSGVEGYFGEEFLRTKRVRSLVFWLDDGLTLSTQVWLT